MSIKRKVHVDDEYICIYMSMSLLMLFRVEFMYQVATKGRVFWHSTCLFTTSFQFQSGRSDFRSDFCSLSSSHSREQLANSYQACPL